MTAPSARVLVNLSWLVPGTVGGSEWTVTDTLRAIADRGPADLDLELLTVPAFQAAHPDLVAAFTTHPLRVTGRVKPARVAAESVAVSRMSPRFDVVHQAGGTSPGRAVRVVLSVYDTQPLDLPQNFSRTKVAYLRWALPRAVASARLVVVPTSWVADQLIERFELSPERIMVVGAPIGRRSTPTPAEELRTRYGLAESWVLTNAITYPHKDHATAVETFRRIAADHPGVDLVLAGGVGPAEARVRTLIAGSGVAHRIHRLGAVPRNDVDGLIAGASVVLFPSRYEGFGLPVVEAMAAGTPVVAAAATALVEVGSDAARLVPPGDVDGFVEALGEVLAGGPGRERLVTAGRARAGDFTPDAAAEGLLSAYRRVLAHR